MGKISILTLAVLIALAAAPAVAGAQRSGAYQVGPAPPGEPRERPGIQGRDNPPPMDLPPAGRSAPQPSPAPAPRAAQPEERRGSGDDWRHSPSWRPGWGAWGRSPGWGYPYYRYYPYDPYYRYDYPPPPAVWIPGQWVWNGWQWVWQPGYWAPRL